MKRCKKLVALLLSGCITLSLAACAGSSSATSSTTESAAPSAATSAAASTASAAVKMDPNKTQVQFWHSNSGNNGKLVEQCVESFNKSQDKIQVIPTFQGGYYDSIAKAQAAIGAGNAPDILQTGSDQVSILSKEDGILENLLPRMEKSGMSIDDFIPAFLTGYYDKANKNLVALPMGCSTPVLYCNMDMFSKAGVSVPTTWDEMKTVSQTLISKGLCEYGFTIPHDSWYFWMIVPQMGGTCFNKDGTAFGCIEDGTGVKAMTLFQDMCKNKTMFFGPAAESDGDCKKKFLSGKSAMYLSSVGNLGSVAKDATFKYSLEYLPKGVKQHTPTGGNSLTMLASGKNKDAAWSFLEWMYTSEEGIAYYASQSGYLPVTNSMAKTEVIKKAWADNAFREKAFKQLEFANNDHRILGEGDVSNNVMAMMEAVLYDFADVTKQMNTLNNDGKSILADIK